MKYGYIRVSSKTQDEERQIQALFSYGVSRENIFIDKASGKNFIDRENWEKLMAKVIVNDIIVIKELDRLGRNNNEIKDTFELLKNKRVFLEFIEQPILNTANKSELEMELLHPIILHLLGYFAEKERVKIRQRQREAYNVLETDKKGRKISRKKGKVVGRPNKIENLTTEQKRYVKAWIDKSIKLRDCIKLTGLSSATLYRIKQNMGNVDKRKTVE
jgi:resolvase/recombinase